LKNEHEFQNCIWCVPFDLMTAVLTMYQNVLGTFSSSHRTIVSG